MLQRRRNGHEKMILMMPISPATLCARLTPPHLETFGACLFSEPFRASSTVGSSSLAASYGNRLSSGYRLANGGWLMESAHQKSQKWEVDKEIDRDSNKRKTPERDTPKMR